MVKNPGSLANIIPPGNDWIGQRFRELEQEIAALRTAIPNAMASRNFDGTLNPPAAGTQGWAYTSDGTAILNNLILRGGIIGDDALTNPISPLAAHADSQSFAITTTDTAIVSLTITVPAGFTQALVFATMSMSGVNSGTADFVSCKVRINTLVGPGLFIGAEAASSGVQVAVANSSSAALTGLGASFVINGMASTQLHTWTAAAGNAANLDANVLFLR